MIKLTLVHVKALILLFVFSLNIVIGFVCSMGLDMKFNCHHHDEENQAFAGYFHSGNKRTFHSRGHFHDTNDLNLPDNYSNEDKDNCCCDEI
ncbi:MAG TPA: hypothetical protein VET23_00015 [Chitinophagaceae bacterium]|nr:hypothetical protein [Chitinophagaceae bacterium]